MKFPREIACRLVEWCPAARNPKNAHSDECDYATEGIEQARADGVRVALEQRQQLVGEDKDERAAAIALAVLRVSVENKDGSGE